MISVETRIEHQDSTFSTPSPEASSVTVKVYTRHRRKLREAGPARRGTMQCMRWLYVYRDGNPKLTSTKTRSWEKAEQKAREIRDSFDPSKLLKVIQSKLLKGKWEDWWRRRELNPRPKMLLVKSLHT